MIGIFIQARSQSTRLPNKCFLPLHDGRNSIQLMYDKAQSWIKTTGVKAIVRMIIDIRDEALFKYCVDNELSYHAIEEIDVLDHFYQANFQYECDYIVRLTGDCPLLDFNLLTPMIERFNVGDYAMITNSLLGKETYPDGMDITIMTRDCLNRLQEEAIGKDRMHVTPWAMNHPVIYKIYHYQNEVNESEYRFTLDHEDDYEVLKQIPTNLTMNQIIVFVEENQLFSNKHKRNEGYLNQK